jgi:hypothetical protein
MRANGLANGFGHERKLVEYFLYASIVVVNGLLYRSVYLSLFDNFLGFAIYWKIRSLISCYSFGTHVGLLAFFHPYIYVSPRGT